MNILQIISKNDRYGAQKIFLDQVSILQEMGQKVIVVTRGSVGYVFDSLAKTGIKAYGIPMSGIRDICLLRGLVKKNNIQIIHTCLDRADYFGLILSKLTALPLVSTMCVPRYHFGYRFANKVIVLSHIQENILLTRGISPEKIKLIRPGINIKHIANPNMEKQSAWKQKIQSERYSIILCHISSIIPRKGHKISLELTAECKAMGEMPLLLIVGDPLNGEYFESLKQRIERLKIKGNVFFTGWTDQIPELLSLSHYTLLPSENEALGIVLMEGMAAGTPIIALEGEGGAELIKEFNSGFLYKRDGNIKELTEKLIELKRNNPQYKLLSLKCKKIAEGEFSIIQFGNKLLGLYLSIKPK